VIVWLASYPRSGNTFLRMLLFSLYGWKTYAGYDPVLASLEASEAVGHAVLRGPLETLEADHRVHFVKTHDLPRDDRPAIYLVRDGRDALVSFARYRQSFPQSLPPTRRAVRALRHVVSGGDNFDTVLRGLIEGRRPFGGWGRNVLAWTDRRQRGRTFPMRYEDLRGDPQGWVQRALEAVGVRAEARQGAAPPDFAALQARWPEFFRKGRAGSWREEMRQALHELFWAHHAEAMLRFGYRRDVDSIPR
jgi:Sulfotransferase domain